MTDDLQPRLPDGFYNICFLSYEVIFSKNENLLK